MPNSKSPKAKTGSESSTATAQPQVHQPVTVAQPNPRARSAPEAAPAPAPAAPQQTARRTSPMVGTFYRAPSPGADPFVMKVGDTVKKGQVVCIIEAMKLLNEVKPTWTARSSLVETASPSSSASRSSSSNNPHASLCLEKF